MKSINLSEWAITHRALVTFFMILVMVLGVDAYIHLGRNEDPEFTIKTMVVQAYLPGATVAETIHQLTDRLEKKLQETPSLDYIKSYTLAGETTIFVDLKTSTDKKQVPDIWYQVRKKIGDIRQELPSGTIGPFFDDEFGETFGIIYGFTADGSTHRELKDIVESLRDELLHVPDVAKIETLGAQDEKIFVEFSSQQLAKLGIDHRAIVAALQSQNNITPSGIIDTGRERLVVEPTGKFLSAGDLAEVTIYARDKNIRLGDIVTIRHGYADPPQPIFRVNGHDAVGLAIAMSKGGDVLALEKNIAAKMASLQAGLPIGVEAHLVANQPQVVREAVNDFMHALIEAIAIVLGISFISLGLRAGTVVALSIPLVLAVVFIAMRYWGIDLQRVSLGALIIALGLLVDDAMITVESMVTKLEEGWTKVNAATFAYTSTAFPMLTGTLATILGFVPIGFAKSDAGEYTFSLFAVVAMALIVSWLVAVIFAPLIGVKMLKENGHHAHGKKPVGRIAAAFHSLLLFSMRHAKVTILLTVAAFLLALAALPLVPEQFFPSSERPELLVNMTLRQSSSIEATNVVSRKLDALLQNDPDILQWSSYIGRGAIRFYLPLDEQLKNKFFTQTVVVTKGIAARERVRRSLEEKLANQVPEVVAGLFALELGPPVGWPVQYRVSGVDPVIVKQQAQKLANIMGNSPHLRKINFNWGESNRALRIHIMQEEAKRLGLTTAAIAQAIYTSVSGVVATQIRDDIYLVDVVLRGKTAERTSINDLRSLSIQLPSGKSMPLTVVAKIEYGQDFPLIWRRDRVPTLTVQADVTNNILPATVVNELQVKVEQLNRALPPDYQIVVGGTVEESAESQTSVMVIMPVMLLLMMAILMIQLENFKHLVLVLSVAPLGVIGVVLALLTTRQPLGFVALLGVVALIGMIIRNSVILVHQIEMEKQAGQTDWDAVADATCLRFRPIMLTAFAAIFGMVPIAPTVFWGPMAYAIMGGLAVATVLTLIFLPSLYVLWFKIKETPIAGTSGSSQ